MSHISKILQNMKTDKWYQPEELEHLGISPKQVMECLNHLYKGGVVEREDIGYRKKKKYKSKQKDLFDAAPQSLIDNAMLKR